MINSLSHELQHIKSWVDANKLSLNVDKTCFMLFSSSRKKVNKDLVIRLDGKTIQRVESTQFLGVIIDSNLTWKKHIAFVKSKVSKGLGIICKSRKFFNKAVLTSLYYSFYPCLSCCIEVWGNVCKTRMLSLFKQQKRLFVLLHLSHSENNTQHPYFFSLKIMTVMVNKL